MKLRKLEEEDNQEEKTNEKEIDDNPERVPNQIDSFQYVKTTSQLRSLPEAFIMLTFDPDTYVPVIPVVLANKTKHLSRRMKERYPDLIWSSFFSAIQEALISVDDSHRICRNIIVNVEHENKKLYIIIIKLATNKILDIKPKILDQYVKPYLDERAKKFENGTIYKYDLTGNTPLEKYTKNMYLVPTILSPELGLSFIPRGNDRSLNISERSKIQTLSSVLYEYLIKNPNKYSNIIKESYYKNITKREFELPGIVKGKLYYINDELSLKPSKPKLIIDDINLDDIVTVDI